MSDVRIVCAIACIILCGCDKCLPSNEVVGHRHNAPWTQWIWLSNGKGGGHLTPIFHPERWVIYYSGYYEKERTACKAMVEVDVVEYHRIIDQFPTPEPSHD